MRTSVAIVRCPDYDPGRVAGAVAGLLEALGGPRAFTAAGAGVLIKPNMLSDAAPEQAVTTHPEVARAVARTLRAAGANLSLGDSPVKAAHIGRVWERTGFADLCAQEGITAVTFEGRPTRPLECAGITLRVAAPAMDADLLVNIPKVKTHLLTIMTGAVKNLYGTLPGYQKTVLHRTFATPSEFGRLPAALYTRLRPALNVADGIVGMEGPGPSGGRPVPLGFLAAATDAVALDTALCAIMGIDPRRLPWTPYLPADTAGLLDAERLDYPGLHPRDVRPRDFVLPSALWPRFIPGGLIRRMNAWLWIRPEFDAKCIRCGRCIKACCNDALRLEPAVCRPVLSPAQCVACCCCHEACPAGAVRMRQSPLLRWVRRGKLP